MTQESNYPNLLNDSYISAFRHLQNLAFLPSYSLLLECFSLNKVSRKILKDRDILVALLYLTDCFQWCEQFSMSLPGRCTVILFNFAHFTGREVRCQVCSSSAFPAPEVKIPCTVLLRTSQGALLQLSSAPYFETKSHKIAKASFQLTPKPRLSLNLRPSSL